MTTVCIIGAGDLGGATAHALARAGRVSRVLLVDGSATAAAGKALDIQQSGAIDGFHTRLEGTDDWTRAAGCAVCVVADRFAPARSEWAGDEGLEMLRRVLPYAAETPIVFAGASQSGLLLGAAREAGVRPARLIGSAPHALAGAIAAIVAIEARCSPAEVALTVLGAPLGGFVVPWSEASIGGHALHRVLSQVQLGRLEARTARLWPPGPFALGLAAARIADAIVRSSRRAYSALTVLDGQFGVRETVGALPVLLGPPGIVHARVPILDTRERVLLDTALQVGTGR